MRVTEADRDRPLREDPFIAQKMIGKYAGAPRRRVRVHRPIGRDALFVAQIATGYAFPNALLQHALEDLERLSVDVGVLERRRDRLVGAMRDQGYETTMPEGTFYVMARSPYRIFAFLNISRKISSATCGSTVHMASSAGR